MYLDVKVRLSNKFWARHRVDSRQLLPNRVMSELPVTRAQSRDSSNDLLANGLGHSEPCRNHALQTWPTSDSDGVSMNFD